MNEKLISVEQFWLTSTLRQRNVRKILKDFGNHVEAMYMAAIYNLNVPGLAAQQSVVYHCFREIINCVVREEKKPQKKEKKDENVKQIENAIKSIDYIKNGAYTHNIIHDAALAAYEKIHQNTIERQRIKNRYIEQNPRRKFGLEDGNQEDSNEVDNITRKVKKVKDDLIGYVHLDQKEHVTPKENLIKSVTTLEEYILRLEKTYIKNKQGIDAILRTQTLTEERVQFVVNVEHNLKPYFFSKLENHEWFETLYKHLLLQYKYFINAEGYEQLIPYLESIVSKIPDKVEQVIDPIIEDMKNGKEVNCWLVHVCCINLAPKMLDMYFTKVWRALLTYITNVDRIDTFVYDNEKLFEIFKQLKTIDEKLVIDIIKQMLKIEAMPEQPNIGCLFETKEKLNYYSYKQIVLMVNDIFPDEPLKLFELYTQIYKSIFNEFTLEQLTQKESLYIIRSAIEDYEQDHFHIDEASYQIVSAIRDSALNVLNTGNKDDINKVFHILSASKYKIFIRVILYLLSAGKNYDTELLEQYLTDYNLFDNLAYIYEYYHLIQNKFEELPQAAQEQIFKYIDYGPKDAFFTFDSHGHTKQEKIDRWRWRKLDPINKFLPEDIKNKYKHFIFDKDGNYKPYGKLAYCSTHISTSLDCDTSPLESNKINEMKIEEIVDFIKHWKPNDCLHSATIRGLAESLQKDVEVNIQKYINKLALFQQIKEPKYISYLLRGLSTAHDKNHNYWEKIIAFGRWVVSQNKNIGECDGDLKWYFAKQTLAELVCSLFRDESIMFINDKVVQNAFQLLQTLVLLPDKHLESNKERTDYYDSAINSLHGVALEGLLIYCIWLKNNNKSLEMIIPILDKVLTESVYLETWAIFGSMLSYIYDAIPQWVHDHLNELLPDNNRDKFNASFIAYLSYSRQLISKFDLLQNKFERVLKEKMYQENKGISKIIGEHLAIYYIDAEIEFDSNIIKYIFDIPENVDVRQYFVSCKV